MAPHTEIERIKQGEGHVRPLPPAFWVFDLDLGDEPTSKLNSIMNVIKAIVEQSSRVWPGDDEWQTILPDWLISYMPELTPREAEKLMNATPREQWGNLPWTFGSWLDAIRERGWAWWGYQKSEGQTRIIVEATDFPPRIEALKQVFKAAGAVILADHPG